MLAYAAGAYAQISLSSAVDLALRNDPRVKMAQANVAKAQASLEEARDAFLPSAKVDGGIGKSVGAPLGLPAVFTISSQSLVFNFSQRDNIRAAALGLQAAQLALKDARGQVAEDTVTTYLSLDAAERKHAAMTEEFGYANRLVAIVQDRMDAGQDARIDVLRARRTAAEIHLASLQLDDQIVNLEDHLTRAIGIPGNRLETVSGSIPPFPAISTTDSDRMTSPNIESAFATAQSKQELAFGMDRYLYRPQVVLIGNYSRLNTSSSQSDFLAYYPNFAGKSNNDYAVALQIQIPFLDFAHRAQARAAEADAAHSLYEARNGKNQFLEGRAKLHRSAEELAARSALAEIYSGIAQEELNAVLIQLSGNGATAGTQLTPKDEQKARVQERQKYIDLLDAQSQLSQTQVMQLRQSGQLDGWLHTLAITPETVATPPAVP